MEREKMTWEEINEAIIEVDKKTAFRIKQKGDGAFASRHEILGAIVEEYHELIKAVEAGSLADVKTELLDLVVAGVLGTACINAEKVDW